MKDRSVAQIKKEIAKLDELLLKEGVTLLPQEDIPVKRGLELLAVLNDKLRPFVVKYTALVNRKQECVTVDTSKLQDYVPLAEELSRCEEVFIGMQGTAYNHALKLIINGFEDVEEGVFELFTAIQMTDHYMETKSLFTYTEDGGLGGINVEKDEDAE
jgi:hypothetical protein